MSQKCPLKTSREIEIAVQDLKKIGQVAWFATTPQLKEEIPTTIRKTFSEKR